MLFVHVGKTGGATAADTFKANGMRAALLHTFPLDTAMLKYYYKIIVSLRDPVERYISSFNNILPGGESPMMDEFFMKCFPNVNFATEALFDSTPCGSVIRNIAGHMEMGYCYYLGGKSVRDALRRKKVFVLRQEFFKQDMHVILHRVGDVRPPHKSVPKKHAATHLSRNISQNGLKNLKLWLHMHGEYDLYREILRYAVNTQDRQDVVN